MQARPETRLGDGQPRVMRRDKRSKCNATTAANGGTTNPGEESPKFFTGRQQPKTITFPQSGLATQPRLKNMVRTKDPGVSVNDQTDGQVQPKATSQRGLKRSPNNVLRRILHFDGLPKDSRQPKLVDTNAPSGQGNPLTEIPAKSASKCDVKKSTKHHLKVQRKVSPGKRSSPSKRAPNDSLLIGVIRANESAVTIRGVWECWNRSHMAHPERFELRRDGYLEDIESPGTLSGIYSAVFSHQIDDTGSSNSIVREKDVRLVFQQEEGDDGDEWSVHGGGENLIGTFALDGKANLLSTGTYQMRLCKTYGETVAGDEIKKRSRKKRRIADRVLPAQESTAMSNADHGQSKKVIESIERPAHPTGKGAGIPLLPSDYIPSSPYNKACDATPQSFKEYGALGTSPDSSGTSPDSSVMASTRDISTSLRHLFNEREVALLRNLGLTTAQQIIQVNDRRSLLARLTAHLLSDFTGRSEQEVNCIAEGLFFSWSLRAHDCSSGDVLTKEPYKPAALSLTDSASEDLETERVSFGPEEDAMRFESPLAYADTCFLRSHEIASDKHLAMCDPEELAPLYSRWVDDVTDERISVSKAVERISLWRRDARAVLSMTTADHRPEPIKTRLGREFAERGDMHTFLCETELDTNTGLPKRTIFAYDHSHYILYRFLITIKDSLCSPNAGHGAFLTFLGAMTLKQSSYAKKRKLRRTHAKTRKPLDAHFPRSGATVRLTGHFLHGDEQNFGNGNVGLLNEFTLDDFEDARDNITFSSNHLGCSLLELSRYAPVLPSDRKTELEFAFKDFIFSSEPSSWRFNVKETLNGQPQVVDFTSDISGSPHETARFRYIAMYVNEVGHNLSLQENVKPLPSATSRSVSYYAYIERSLQKGEEIELLTNYGTRYESMRERRGYGKNNAVKSDHHNETRVIRNLAERKDIVALIRGMSEDGLCELTTFLSSKIRKGLDDATSFTCSGQASGEDKSDLIRQCVARRRISWVSSHLKKRLSRLQDAQVSQNNDHILFKPGTIVYVHDWPQDDARPPYTGLGTISDCFKDEEGRDSYEITVSDNKYIEHAPEAVLTIPTEEDLVGAPKRTRASWQKWKRERTLPQRRRDMFQEFDSCKWDPSMARILPFDLANQYSFQVRAKILESLRWDVVEEVLFLVCDRNLLFRPYDEKIWCRLSMDLMTTVLHILANYLLNGATACVTGPYDAIINAAKTASDKLRYLAASLDDLALASPKSDASEWVVVVDSVLANRMQVDVFKNSGAFLDMEWYLTRQVMVVVHPLLLLLRVDSYSVETLCGAIGLDATSPFVIHYETKARQWDIPGTPA